MSNKMYNPRKEQKAAHRQALINEGLYGRFKESYVPSGKTYKRKERNGKPLI